MDNKINNNQLKIQHVEKSFVVNGESMQVLQGIDLTINQGEFIVIVGHSGCGKSTLLKMIAGLEHPDSGSVEHKGVPITAPSKERGMIFQEHRLFPWMTIEKNVALGITTGAFKTVKKEVEEYLEMVKLSEFKKAYPRQLSGGMSQRAAIARALISNPEILLLDEPFGALDAMTKIELQKEIKRLWSIGNNTMIMVTHDIEEAVYLADRIVVMSSRPGKILDVIDVTLGTQRDRGSLGFAEIKKKVYDYFFEDGISQVEYNL